MKTILAMLILFAAACTAPVDSEDDGVATEPDVTAELAPVEPPTACHHPLPELSSCAFSGPNAACVTDDCQRGVCNSFHVCLHLLKHPHDGGPL